MPTLLSASMTCTQYRSVMCDYIPILRICGLKSR